jgi:hypothetical protein
MENVGISIADPELKTGKLRIGPLGRPQPISGNFGCVFSITSEGGRMYAVKCFVRMADDQGERYRSISDRLASIKATWKMDLEYVNQGVLVSGEWFPVLKMEWIRGVGLIRWIEEHLSRRDELEELARRFGDLILELQSQGIAHGDLQHGNVLVSSTGTLRLVDYDGMFVPELAGRAGMERGLGSYQSPMRHGVEFGPHLDWYSAWVIYASMVAVAEDPDLWRDLHQPDGEYLILTESDLRSPQTSPALDRLLRHRSARIRGLSTLLSSTASLPIEGVPAFSSTQIPRISGVPMWLYNVQRAGSIGPGIADALRNPPRTVPTPAPIPSPSPVSRPRAAQPLAPSTPGPAAPQFPRLPFLPGIGICAAIIVTLLVAAWSIGLIRIGPLSGSQPGGTPTGIPTTGTGIGTGIGPQSTPAPTPTPDQNLSTSTFALLYPAGLYVGEDDVDTAKIYESNTSDSGVLVQAKSTSQTSAAALQTAELTDMQSNYGSVGTCVDTENLSIDSVAGILTGYQYTFTPTDGSPAFSVCNVFWFGTDDAGTTMYTFQEFARQDNYAEWDPTAEQIRNSIQWLLS